MTIFIYLNFGSTFSSSGLVFRVSKGYSLKYFSLLSLQYNDLVIHPFLILTTKISYETIYSYNKNLIVI